MGKKHRRTSKKLIYSKTTRFFAEDRRDLPEILHIGEK